MRQSVRDIFFDFSAQREGFTPFMYCDTLNLVTTGIGNLVDASGRNTFDISAGAMAPAMNLPWKFKAPGWTSKNPLAADTASQADIREAWIRTKLKEQEVPEFNKGGGFKYAGLTPLTLDMAGLKALFEKTLTRFDGTLAGRYRGYETYPADAQLAMLSMAWAMGPAFNFPQFKAAMEARDFEKAAELSFFKGGGGTPEKRSGRNGENQIMLQTAAVVEKTGADPDRLTFPGTRGSVTPGTGPLPVPFNMDGAVSAMSTAKAAAAVGSAGLGAWGLYKLWRKYK